MAVENSGDSAQVGVRRTSGSLRELMLEAGVEVLERNGLGLRPDSISYAKVFAYLEQEYSVRITRGSVHERIWTSHDDFRREVLALSLLNLPLDVPVRMALSDLPTTTKFAEQFLSEPNPMEAYARSVATLIWQRSVGSEVADLLVSIKAIASRFNDPITAEVLRAELDRREAEQLTVRPAALLAATQELQLQSNPNIAIPEPDAARILYLMLDAFMLGGHLNERAGCSDPSQAQSYHPVGASGEDRWTTGSVAAIVFFDMFFEQGQQPPGNEQRVPVADQAVQDFQDVIDLRTPTAPASLLEDTNKSGQRRTRNELKQLVLTAGQELFLRDGLLLQPDALRYSTVLSHIRERHGIVINRASVHGRIWATHADYCLEVIARSVSEAPLSVQPASQSKYPVDADALSPGERRAMVFDRMRRHMLSQVEHMVDSQPFRQRLLVKAALVDQDGSSEAMDELCRIIRQTDDDRIDFNVEMVAGVFARLGFEVKPGIGLTFDEACLLLTQVTQVVVIGVVFNQLCGNERRARHFSIPRSDGSGETDEWNLAGLAVRACFEHFFQDRRT